MGRHAKFEHPIRYGDFARWHEVVKTFSADQLALLLGACDEAVEAGAPKESLSVFYAVIWIDWHWKGMTPEELAAVRAKLDALRQEARRE